MTNELQLAELPSNGLVSQGSLVWAEAVSEDMFLAKAQMRSTQLMHQELTNRAVDSFLQSELQLATAEEMSRRINEQPTPETRQRLANLSAELEAITQETFNRLREQAALPRVEVHEMEYGLFGRVKSDRIVISR